MKVKLKIYGIIIWAATFPGVYAQEISTAPMVGTMDSSPHSPAAAPTASDTELLRQSSEDLTKGNLDDALKKVNAVLDQNSQNPHAHSLRGSIYAEQKQWDKADYDYEVALVLDPGNSVFKFNVAELKFMQKQYDDARPDFTALQSDKDLGDFAIYRVFLCDLLGGHEDAAAKDLDALDQVGGNPSYYFAHAAWDLVHNKTDEASDWLKSASRIYSDSPGKFANYSACLFRLGYLPLRLSSAL